MIKFILGFKNKQISNIMKNLKLLSFLMVFASSLMFIQCTTDTLKGLDGADGIAGIDGVDGLDGTDGLDGADVAVCISCHSNNHRDAINDAYALSNHATSPLGSWAYAGTRASCAQCHSNQGFIEFQETGQVAAGFANPEPISCTGCHKAHRSFDFANDGNDYALRTITPVTLIVDNTYAIDIKNESDELGKSNTCVNCHQPRRSGPTADANGEFAVTSSHWGPHYGAQSTLLEGIQGYEFSSDGISAPKSAAHRAKMSCVSCHMAKAVEVKDGVENEFSNHTWNPAVSASATCTTCHDNKPEVAGFATGMAELGGLLESVVGWEYVYKIKRVGDVPTGDPVLNADGDLQFLNAAGAVTTKSAEYVILLDTDGVTKLTQDVIGILHDGHPNTGFYGRGATFTIKEAGAAWNYLFLSADNSNGVHNPVYAKALLAQSILAL